MNKARRKELKKIMTNAHSLYNDIALYDSKAKGKGLLGVCLSLEMTGRYTGKRLPRSIDGKYIQGTFFSSKTQQEVKP